jgi:hypothetical protein
MFLLSFLSFGIFYWRKIMSQQAFRQTVVVFGVDGQAQDQAKFPGILKAALRLLVNSMLGSGLGPAVTSDLLLLMKTHLSSGLSVGGRRYIVVVCVPKAPVSRRTTNYRCPFFALAEKGHGDRIFYYPEHKDCAIVHLEEF